MDWLKFFFACEIIIDMSRYSENRIVMLEGYIQCIYIYICTHVLIIYNIYMYNLFFPARA